MFATLYYREVIIVSLDEVGDTLVLVPSAATAATAATATTVATTATAGNCLFSGGYRPQF
jgi:hypothetical protein